MPDSLESQLFRLVAAAHVASGGIIRISRTGFSWGVIHMDKQVMFMVGDGKGQPKHTPYGEPEGAVHAFERHFGLMGVKEVSGVGLLDDTEFLFPDVHANVAVTWRHLKARFKGVKLILKRERRIMEDIIEEAASM